MKTILLVEDEEAIRTPLAELLADADEEHRVIAASNGREAANVLLSSSVDLVITDLMMPVMDGFTLLAHLMRCHPHLPVIVITAYGTADTKRKLEALGALDCLEKPTDFKALPALVRAKLAQRAEGRVVGITLPGLLQLLNLEQKTCTLAVTSNGRRGQLHCLAGELVHAEDEASRGIEAAYDILSWSEPVIEIGAASNLRERTIDAPLGHVVLEAARLKDEREEARRSDVHLRAGRRPPAVSQAPLSHGDAPGGAERRVEGAARR